MGKKKDIVKSTESGRLYIDASDFFQQKEVKDQIECLMESSIYKEIQEGKKAENEKAVKG